MKLVSTLISLLSATLILPFVCSNPLPQVASEIARAKGFVAAEHVPTTNAERFARGLPPLSPSQAHKRGSPTRRTGASPVPLTTYTGYISVYQGKTLQGYMSRASGGYYRDLTNDSSMKLLVSFALPVGQTSGSALNLQLKNSLQSAAQSAPYLGLASDYNWEYSYSRAYFTSTVMTSGGPSGGTNGLGYSNIESNIWSVNLLTGALVPSWTTASGAVKSDLWTSPAVFVGDGSDFGTSSYTRGTFNFVPQ